MHLEAVVVCHNYSDFLEHTLPENLQFFDRMVVVTHPDDKKTHALCNKFSVDMIQTTVMHEENDAFNKGRCINLGLSHLRQRDWVVHIDADIVLPHNFRGMLDRARLHRENLYGADRVNVHGYDHWMEHKDKRVPHYSNRYFIEPPRQFPLGARLIHPEHGYTPLGYFQLWHSSMGKRYPIHQGNAEHTDVLFAAQWTRQQRVLLPELIVYHLDSLTESAPMGANWNGRKTPHFGPKHHHHECSNGEYRPTHRKK